MTASNELNFSRPDSATANHPVKDTALSNPPKSSSNVTRNLNHLEKLSQYTRPGVAVSVAQEEALYRECFLVQLQQALSDRRLEQAEGPSGSGLVNPVNQIAVNVQNVALPPLQPPMQSSRPPTRAMPPLNSKIFVPDFSAKPQTNQTMDRLVLHLRPKSDSLPGQLHLPNPPFAQQQNLPQSNIPHETQLPIDHPMLCLSPLPNHFVIPLLFLPSQQLVNPQLSVIPSFIPASTATYIPVPNIQLQKH